MSVITDLIDENSSCHARIAELEARIVWLECELQVNAAPVSEAKAHGVVQWPEADEIMQMAFEEGQPADDASGYCFELEEFDLFIERLMSEVARLNAAPVSEAKAQGVVMPERKEFPELMMADYHEVRGWNACLGEVARLNAASVQQPKCKTCNDNGRIGGPSFYAPDEGGEPCPDCSAPAQQASVPDASTDFSQFLSAVMDAAGLVRHGRRSKELSEYLGSKCIEYRCFAAPAAPAADAGLVAVEWAKDAEEWGPALNEAGWLFLSELNEDQQKSALIFNNTKGPLRAAIMKYAEIVTAHRAKGVV